jgi:hypothetical protein
MDSKNLSGNPALHGPKFAQVKQFLDVKAILVLGAGTCR